VNIYISVKYRTRNIFFSPVSIILFHKTFVDSFLCVQLDLGVVFSLGKTNIRCLRSIYNFYSVFVLLYHAVSTAWIARCNSMRWLDIINCE
jgi:hypothetical protein